MTSPYRTAAIVAEPEQRNVMRYVIAKFDKSTDGDWLCPMCWESIKFVRPCNPFRRVTVAGLLWWSKPCPLPGVHWHYDCSCGAHVVSRDNDATEVKEAILAKEKP